jgi:hypothetical protein
MGHETPMNAGAGQSQVAHRVEQFVADELIRGTQPLGVHHAGAIDHHGVLQAAAERQAGCMASISSSMVKVRASANTERKPGSVNVIDSA